MKTLFLIKMQHFLPEFLPFASSVPLKVFLKSIPRLIIFLSFFSFHSNSITIADLLSNKVELLDQTFAFNSPLQAQFYILPPL